MEDEWKNFKRGQRKVYWGSGSPQAWRVMLALEEKQLPYENNLISFESGVLKTAPMLALNPRGKVPIYVEGQDDGPPIVIFESMAILQFIEEYYPSSLYPATEGAPPPAPHCNNMDTVTAKQRFASSVMRVHEANNLSTVCGELVFYLRRTSPEDRDMEFLNRRHEALNAELRLWENYLGSDCYYGGAAAPTLPDFAVFPNLAYIVRMGKHLEKLFPRLHAYYNLMMERPSVKNTWPPHWKETPRKTLLFVESEVGGGGDGGENGVEVAAAASVDAPQEASGATIHFV